MVSVPCEITIGGVFRKQLGDAIPDSARRVVISRLSFVHQMEGADVGIGQAEHPQIAFQLGGAILDHALFVPSRLSMVPPVVNQKDALHRSPLLRVSF